MAPRKSMRSVLLAEIESTYQTDPTPAADTNAIDAVDFSIEPLVAEQVARNKLKTHLGADPDKIAGQHVAATFSVELQGSGTAGTAPAYGPLLRACAMSQTINAGTSVVYAPVDASEESATLYWYEDGSFHKMIGARGNAVLSVNARQIPMLRFSMIGLYTRPTAASLPTGLDFTGFKDPAVISNAATPTFTLDGFSAVLESLELDLGNQVRHIERVNSSGAHRTDRQGSHSVTIEDPAIGSKDFYAIADSNVDADSVVAGELIHGATGGSIIEIDWLAQLRNPSKSDQDGVAMLSMSGNLVPSASGNDDLVLTVK